MGKHVTDREYLESLITQGDGRLQQHIDMQIEQVKGQHHQVQTALESADKLEQARLANLERQITLQLAARDVAIDKAESANEKRFAAVNEFRGQLNDQAHTFLPREVYENQHSSMLLTIAGLTKRLDEQAATTAGGRAALGLMMSIAVIMIAAVSFLANYLTSH